ncbi:MAG: hypothetical protein COV32_01775 [Candidatus Yonathbacteria bacterium CG10_big_fil_rev_8_21_14_0_10_43_136]|uniref:Septum formation initiator n=2 Tax=Parcubacteria group TaxID=1794811 RepID=A0A2M7Q5U0_9BACT|nr:MAG: hypothetical protein COW60_03520 [Candidatus Yonathbacteria bacterium CG17_big_fil_post_rev_8_21_14_2_50_43_9]PIR40730.1 MAG: hypothetical protein COV32_01775 [Candidatus Yonathbacteria bacterium CG10_big_fil_rev_8_21_14_0_10_43_136]PIX57315.1 MAG: hypothetical protein COZ48_01240 [Candidatus Yonathbacteria bacterium CG_4_10_14_3_um_filter_43_12]PIY58569.1 MAG: hypothetical protein COY98_01335 [Candidatus Yonathbacteria bacterium CG_4_10_14_0_8_um_filter_43_17]PJC22564.1 MAG: hypothetic
MIPFQERKKLRKILYSKISLVILAVMLFFVGKGAWGIHQKAQIAISERNIAQRSLLELEARTVELQASLIRLKSDIGVEEEIRQKYSVVRPGEEVVVIVDDRAKKSENSKVGIGNWILQSIISFFGF